MPLGAPNWLNKISKCKLAKVYILYRKDIEDQHGDGILIAVKTYFISNEVEDMSPVYKCEMIRAKHEFKGSN